MLVFMNDNIFYNNNAAIIETAAIVRVPVL